MGGGQQRLLNVTMAPAAEDDIFSTNMVAVNIEK